MQPIAYSAWSRIASEAWAIISGELVSKSSDGHGINLAALQADLGRLDTPPPAPAPAGTGLLAELAGLIRDVAASTEKDVTELLAWLASHRL